MARGDEGAATEYCASVAAAPGLLSELLLCYNSYEFLHYACFLTLQWKRRKLRINQYRAKGDFVNVLLQVVALDNVICLLTFSLTSAVISGIEGGSLGALDVILPIVYNLASLIIGFIFGFILYILSSSYNPQ